MYDVRPNLYIGFHGCDEDVRTELVINPNSIKISEKPYDWLGHGFYVWENNYERALEWAKIKQKHGKIKKASVVGVVYLLGNCLDFTDSKFIHSIELYYHELKYEFEKIGKQLPFNKDAHLDTNKDKLVRELDCAVIEYLHQKVKENNENDNLDSVFISEFETCRGLFTEGGSAFPGAGIQKKNHIQVCIRNLNCIKAFFIPRSEIKFP
jgi:hypothetical protein